MKNNFKYIKCNLCEKNDAEELYLIKRFKKHFKIVKCRNCGLVYVNPQPTEEELRKYYNSFYRVPLKTNEKLVLKKARELINEIKRTKKTGSLLEIGCSYGFLLQYFKRREWYVKGIEISQEASDYARSRFGIDVFTGTLREYKRRERFDLIVMLDVLEHLSNPAEELSLVNKYLKKDGLLVLTTPNIDSLDSWISKDSWEWMIPPEHLFYFSSETISSLLHKYNFRILSLKTSKGDAHQSVLSFFQSYLNRAGCRYISQRTNMSKPTLTNYLDLKLCKKLWKYLYAILSFLDPFISLTYIPILYISAIFKVAPTLIITAKKVEGKRINQAK